MKQIIILLTFVCLKGLAQANSEVNPGWLWEISGNGLAKKSYLFGTCHGEGHNFTDEEIYSIYGLREAMDEVHAVFLEHTADSKLQPETKKEDLEKFRVLLDKINHPGPEFMMPKGVFYKPLFDSVSHFNEFNKFMTYKMKDPEYWKKTPGYWCIRMSMYLFDMPRKNVRSVDSALREACLNSGKELGSLEPYEFAANKLWSQRMDVTSIDTMSMKEQVKLAYQFMQICDNDSLFKESGLHKVYLVNDTVRFARYMEEQHEDIEKKVADSTFLKALKEKEEYEQLHLLSERNEAWMPVIEKNIASRHCMIAVGCRHLMGSNSLIAILRKKGYTVTPVIER